MSENHLQTILVVDDEKPILGLIDAYLGSQGLSCVTTTDPAEALSIMSQRPIDLVLSDIHMKGFSGVELLERAQEIDPDTMVILMTGQPSVDTAVQSMKSNAYDYITKPFDLEQLHEVVQRALEKQRLARENAALKDTLKLYQLSQAVSASVDEQEVLRLTAESILRELSADAAALFVSTDGSLVSREQLGPDSEIEELKRMASEVVRRGESILLPDDSGLLDGFGNGSGNRAKTALGVPLRGRGEVIGAVTAIRTRGPKPFSRGNLRTVEILSGNAAAAIENARQTRQVIRGRAGLVEANAATIGALIAALDAREHETQVHSIRVTEYALRLAEEVDYPIQGLVELKFGAMLHDIGKIGVPDHILLKPGPLTEEEWHEMKRHPMIGYQILRDIKFLENAAKIVLYHQERFDGTGYPFRLKGAEIPLGARLFAVIDTFDSMTNDRPYRKALSYDAVVEELERFRGTQFDPAIVDAFKRVPIEDWKRIGEEAANNLFMWDQISLRGGFSMRDLGN